MAMMPQGAALWRRLPVVTGRCLSSMLRTGTGSRYLGTTPSSGTIDADVIITNGRVIDPANDVDTECDVAIKDNVIVAVGRGLRATSGRDDMYFDASGCLVTPGLIDIQVHAYQYATPYGLDIDRHCLGRGVTTAVDGGASGATTFLGLKKFVGETKKTRLLAFLNVAMHGMAAGDKEVGGEYDSLKLVDPALCISCIQDNPEVLVGVKVRLRADACASGKNEDDAFRIALSASQKAGVPLLTHHAESTIPTEAMTGTMGCPGSLRAGDIYSQVYQGHASGILNPSDLNIYGSVLNARDRGVLFDVGHGQRAFSWTVAERCGHVGFYPDIISTNLHVDNIHGPVYDLLTLMTKMIYVGMPLTDIIRAVTSNAAHAIRRSDLIGSLGVSRCADITVLRETPSSIELEDAYGQTRQIRTKLTPEAVWRSGVRHDIVDLEVFPNPKVLSSLRETLSQAVIHDKQARQHRKQMKN